MNLHVHAHQTASQVAPFATTEEILEEFRNGRMVVIVDAEDRENEGDLIVPAQMATPDAINFMAKHGRGLICLALSQDRATELQLDFMVRRNASRNRTAFTQSIEARDGISTGISARDRARTIAVAIDPTKGAADIVSPGHVFPLIAREGGVLVRAGHTEASVDLTRLAGLMPAAVICEIMNDDGTMARVPDLIPFAQAYGLKIGTIEDLIAYRLRNDRLVRQVASTAITSAYGGHFDLRVFSTTVDPVEHIALVKGDLSAPGALMVRVHAVSAMSDLIGVEGKSGEETAIAKAMRTVARAGRGVVILIRDPGPKSISNWIEHGSRRGRDKDRENSARQVEIGIGSQILRHLGVTEMILLTNSAANTYVGLEAFGLQITETRLVE
jgi:3,4-dihydroxy 2-butanone 4-phosphate synthase/GTP cyclohydrolase II